MIRISAEIPSPKLSILKDVIIIVQERSETGNKQRKEPEINETGAFLSM
jgi:hypothetical protein